MVAAPSFVENHFPHMVNSCSKRFCALTLSATNPVTNCTFNTLIINAYLPTDYGTPDSNNAYIEDFLKDT